jgi:hypothetical protein
VSDDATDEPLNEDGSPEPFLTLAPGQVWTTFSDPPLRVLIGRIEQLGDRPVVSVMLLGSPAPEGFETRTLDIHHAPFDAPALIAELEDLEAEGVEIPASFEEGYAEWKGAGGGVWTIGPVQVAGAVADTAAKNR